jgi:hypothetical protein
MKTEKLIRNLIDRNSSELDYSFKEEFITIIIDKCEGYNGSAKERLKDFLNDLQRSGCISGLIGDFIYHSDTKKFYIDHIDDLEQYKEDIEDSLGESIENRQKIVHYTFIVWLCFEEFCYTLYRNIFEN